MKKYKNLKGICVVLGMMLCSTIFLSSGTSVFAEKAAEPAIELSEEELEFVREQDAITIGCRTGDCPVIFREEGEIRGITIDILDMISEATGLEFRYQELPQGNVTYADLQELQVDMVASVECNEVNEQSLGIALTEPYLQAEKVFICRRGEVFDVNSEMVIAVASGSQTLDGIIHKIYPAFQTEFYDSPEEALSALLSGKVDAVLQNQYSAERILAKPLYEKLQIVAAASIGDAHCLAALIPISEERENVIADRTRLLISVLNKGIEALDKSQVSFAVIKGRVENAYSLTIWDLLYRYGYAVAVVTLSIVLAAVLLWRNRVLQKTQKEQRAAEERAKELAALNEHMHEQQVLLKDALERAEEGNRAKTTFLFNMSHDIRTPMNAILGFTAIAYNCRNNWDKLTGCLDKIQESGNHLLELINGLLDMARIESGKVMLTEDSCNLVEVVGKVGDILQTEMNKKNLTVHFETPAVTDEWVCCDKLRVNQILFNLLSNAIKFSKDSGIIDVILYQKPSDMREYAVYELHVKDTGIGMSPEFASHIFEPFERERTSTVSKTQGAGLGMSITKNLVDLMGGTIEVYSEPDKGTEFVLYFTFKLQKDMQKAEEKPEEDILPAAYFRGRRLLLAEDNELNREIAMEFLEEDGFIIETAEDGKRAVEMVRNSAPGYYDAVLMDIQMPVMDGYQATREIRRLKTKELADIPVIAMTANAFEEDKKEALANGMNAHIAKPVDIGTLRRVLKELVKF